MEISLKAEKITQIGPFDITNTMISSIIIVVFFVILAFLIKRTRYDLKNTLYHLVEVFVEWFYGIVSQMLGKGKTALYVFPLVATFFLFIITNNWFGLFPGVNSVGIYEPKHHQEISHVEPDQRDIISPGEKAAGILGEAVHTSETSTADEVSADKEELVFVPLLRSANSDINMTLAIALISIVFVQMMGFRQLGVRDYAGKFFNFSNPINFFIGILELISETIKIFSFAFRLFGNTFAGDVLLLVVFGLVPYLIPAPFIAFELLAGFIQALVFSMLTLAFIKTAITSHHPPHEQHAVTAH